MGKKITYVPLPLFSVILKLDRLLLTKTTYTFLAEVVEKQVSLIKL